MRCAARLLYGLWCGLGWFPRPPGRRGQPVAALLHFAAWHAARDGKGKTVMTEKGTLCLAGG